MLQKLYHSFGNYLTTSSFKFSPIYVVGILVIIFILYIIFKPSKESGADDDFDDTLDGWWKWQ